MKELEIAISKLWERWGKSKPEAQTAADYFNKQFLDLLEQQEHHIVLHTVNIADGIGDFKNLLDYYLWCKNIFKDFKNVHIKALAFLSSSKISVAKRILPNEINAQWFNLESVADYGQLQAELILIETWDDKNGAIKLPETADYEKIDIFLDNNEHLLNLLRSTDFFFNIATPLAANKPILGCLPQKCWIRSRREYGPVNYDNSHSNLQALYLEDEMGIRPDDAGIKFNEKIVAYVKDSSLPDKADRLAKLSNQSLLKKLIDKNDCVAYLSQTDLAIAYLQHPNATISFIFLALQTAKTQNIDVIVNIPDVNFTIDTNLLSQLGISKFELIDSNGTTIKEILTEKKQTGRRLRSFNFIGINTTDEEILTSVANIIGGSGDDSISKTFFAFPFFHILPHKNLFGKHFIEFIGRLNQNKNEYPELLAYLASFAKDVRTKTVNPNDFAQISHDFDKINAQWQQIFKIIYENHNAKDSFQELIFGFLFSRWIENNDNIKDIQNAVNYLISYRKSDKFSIAKENILQYALVKRNFIMASYLLKIANINLETKIFNQDITLKDLAISISDEDIPEQDSENLSDSMYRKIEFTVSLHSKIMSLFSEEMSEKKEKKLETTSSSKENSDHRYSNFFIASMAEKKDPESSRQNSSEEDEKEEALTQQDQYSDSDEEQNFENSVTPKSSHQ